MTQSDKGHSSNAELADKYEREGWIDITELDNPEEWRQIIAALRQSSDKALVPRDQFKWNYHCPSEARECEAIDFCSKHQCCGRSGEPLLLTYALSAAEGHHE